MKSESEIKRGKKLLKKQISTMEQSDNPESYREGIAEAKGKIKALDWILGDALL